jgi:glycosyltransferase involved in cell wall biosynthesis
MRILHLLGPMILPCDPDTAAASGVVRAALEIARAQAKQGHEVWVAAVGQKAWEAEWLGVKLMQLQHAAWARRTLGRRTLDFRTHLPYITLTRKSRFDVVQGHLYMYLRFLNAGARVAHFHNDPLYPGGGDQNISFTGADFNLIERHSDAQVAVSNFIAEQLCKSFRTPDRIHVVHNGVDVERYAPGRWYEARQHLRREWGVQEGEVVFLYAGAIVPEKGVLHLARAFACVSEQVQGVHLAVAGSSTLWDEHFKASDACNSYENQVRHVLDTVQRQGRVHFLGKLGTAMMPCVYAASDVVVVPSVWQEAFGLVAVEALASGRPVIASATGGLPEVVNESNGCLVAAGDEVGLEAALRTLAHEPDLRHRLGQRARKDAMRFTWAQSAQALEAIYTSVLDSKG